MHAPLIRLWHEIRADLGAPDLSWQILVIGFALSIAWLINTRLKQKINASTQLNYQIAIASFNRALFPLVAAIIVMLGILSLRDWKNVHVLQLTCKLLFAMAAIRLLVYGLRRTFNPNGWIKSFEKWLAWLIWGLVALYLLGYLEQIIASFESVKFFIGKTPTNLWVLLQGLLILLATLFFSLWFSRSLESKLLAAEHMSLNIRVVLTKLVRILVVTISGLFALSAVGFDITLLSVFGGALGVGLGFGLQRIASNYVSGFILLLDKSMQIGDMISVDKHYGVVQDLRSRYTVLAKTDGTHVIIPNESLMTGAVVNHALKEHRGHVQINVFVAYSTNLEQAMQLMREIAANQPRLSTQSTSQVLIKAFTEHGAELQLNVWVKDPENPTQALQSALYFDIWQQFHAHQIKLGKQENISA